MNHKQSRKAKRAELGEAADLLIQEMNEGKWDHITNLKSTPIEEIKELNDELEKRCPGYEKEKYGEAIARSIYYNR